MPAHIRKWPQRPGEYVEVADYQERIEAPPSPVDTVPKQGELALVIDEPDDEKREE